MSRGRVTAAGTPAALKAAAAGRDGAAVTLDNMFMPYHAGADLAVLLAVTTALVGVGGRLYHRVVA